MKSCHACRTGHVDIMAYCNLHASLMCIVIFKCFMNVASYHSGEPLLVLLYLAGLCLSIQSVQVLDSLLCATNRCQIHWPHVILRRSLM